MPRIGSDFTNIQGLLPSPNLGILGGIAEGVRSAIGGYREAKHDQQEDEQRALQNQMIQKNYQLGLFKDMALETGDPNKPFTVDLARQKEMQDRQKAEAQEKALDELNIKRGGEGLGLVPRYMMDATRNAVMAPPGAAAQPGQGAPASPGGLVGQDGLIQLPGGRPIKAQLEEAQLKELQQKASDPVKNAGEFGQERVKDIANRLDAYEAARKNVANALKVFDDPKADNEQKRDALKLAAGAIAQDKEGRINENVRRDIVKPMTYGSDTFPFVKLHPDPDAARAALQRRYDDLTNNIESARKEAQSNAPGLRVPPTTGLLQKEDPLQAEIKRRGLKK